MRFNLRMLAALLCALMLAMTAVPVLADAETAPFILGVDVSELLSQEASGVKYYDADGNESDALRVLAEYGVNHIRLRVWNDPFDADGYGAGNINADVAAQLSARAAGYGMKTLLDFHYSDFWADPSRQLVPKAWEGMNLDEKATALADYTRETLSAILDAGGDVDMVQIGNETNYGMCGEGDASMARLIAEGCAAARETASAYGRPLTVCVHLTDPRNTAHLRETLSLLIGAGADFDAVGLSYYPYWHGTLGDLSAAVQLVRESFGKEAFVAETAWPFTLEQGDLWGDVVNYDPGLYPVSPEGQAQAFTDVCGAAQGAGALGVFYWGGIWTPVGTESLEDNWTLWEQFGSGWASSYAASYDPEHVGEDYGGSAWDNQAMFDFTGHPLEILNAVRRMADGDMPEIAADVATDASEEVAEPRAEAENLLRNPGFEDADYSMWEAASLTGDIPFDMQDFVNDAHSGTVAFHYWSESAMHFTIQQTITGLEAGRYAASAWSQGGDMTDAAMTFYVLADGQRYETSFMNTSWADWQHPALEDIPISGGELTVGVEIACGARSWGTLDDFSVSLMP